MARYPVKSGCEYLQCLLNSAPVMHGLKRRGIFDFNESTASISSSSPLPLLALVPTTGTPSSRARAGISTHIFFRLASSIRFMQTTVRGVISIICKTRLRFLSKQVASHTVMQASAFPLRIKSRATSSSTECVKSEYVPGRSTVI